MSKYVDIEPFINGLKNYKEVAESLLQAFESYPTADVRENVKGEWLYKGLDFEIDSLYQCSACKHYHWSKSNYCPNCGADMRGEV